MLIAVGRRRRARQTGPRRPSVVFLFARRAGARGAHARAGARRDPRADGPDAGRGARPRRRRASARAASTDDPLGDDHHRPARREDSARRRVVAGDSDVNQAPVTGESLPVDKAPGDEVFAGTINGRGALDVRVTRLRRDTTLARIIHLVERAQAQRAPSQTLRRSLRARLHAGGHRARGRWSPSCRRSLFAPAAGSVWLYRALVLLVVSCPCALVISTPVSIVAALAGAARERRAHQGRRAPRARRRACGASRSTRPAR